MINEPIVELATERGYENPGKVAELVANFITDDESIKAAIVRRKSFDPSVGDIPRAFLEIDFSPLEKQIIHRVLPELHQSEIFMNHVFDRVDIMIAKSPEGSALTQTKRWPNFVGPPRVIAVLETQIAGVFDFLMSEIKGGAGSLRDLAFDLARGAPTDDIGIVPYGIGGILADAYTEKEIDVENPYVVGLAKWLSIKNQHNRFKRDKIIEDLKPAIDQMFLIKSQNELG